MLILVIHLAVHSTFDALNVEGRYYGVGPHAMTHFALSKDQGWQFHLLLLPGSDLALGILGARSGANPW
jgi:hypothetical protein